MSASEAKRAFDNAQINANHAIAHLHRAVETEADNTQALQALAAAIRDVANGLSEIAKGR